MYTIKAALMLDSSGDRIVARYFPIDQRLRTRPEQVEFEKALFNKTARQNAEIISFEGYTTIYKTIVDVSFYIVGSAHENELILLNTLNTLLETLSIVMRDRVDKKALMEYIDLVFLALDELIDDGVILETDPQSIAQRVSLKSEQETPISEQTISQVVDRASDVLKKFISN
eukprot:TRINITY_DN9812_c0_g1_i1.p1 TRINITY_DN9812_c0_g1~~TRINITY_DN9812_c0_g1_i1.p1  ORF type:complete len:172 (-),score=42.70 TRINITY_DN9812_c0_g1_i1:106-621(-)